jgi:hypothetical protein
LETSSFLALGEIKRVEWKHYPPYAVPNEKESLSYEEIRSKLTLQSYRNGMVSEMEWRRNAMYEALRETRIDFSKSKFAAGLLQKKALKLLNEVA